MKQFENVPNLDFDFLEGLGPFTKKEKKILTEFIEKEKAQFLNQKATTARMPTNQSIGKPEQRQTA